MASTSEIRFLSLFQLEGMTQFEDGNILMAVVYFIWIVVTFAFFVWTLSTVDTSSASKRFRWAQNEIAPMTSFKISLLWKGALFCPPESGIRVDRLESRWLEWTDSVQVEIRVTLTSLMRSLFVLLVDLFLLNFAHKPLGRDDRENRLFLTMEKEGGNTLKKQTLNQSRLRFG